VPHRRPSESHWCARMTELAIPPPKAEAPPEGASELLRYPQEPEMSLKSANTNIDSYFITYP
jgi:hypothetical protein